MGITIGEQQMWHHIGSMAQSLNRIANCMEAEEARKRKQETWNDDVLGGNCSVGDCLRPVITMINEDRFCEVHLNEAFTMLKTVRESIQAGLADMEQAVKEGK